MRRKVSTEVLMDSLVATSDKANATGAEDFTPACNSHNATKSCTRADCFANSRNRRFYRHKRMNDPAATVFASHAVTTDDLLATLPDAHAQVFAELLP